MFDLELPPPPFQQTFKHIDDDENKLLINLSRISFIDFIKSTFSHLT